MRLTPTPAETEGYPLNRVFLFLLIATVLCILVLACTPPFSRDALIHHLQIPKLYLQHGGIYEIPNLIFSYYPMNLDLLYTGALYLGNDILPKYIHMIFGLATAILLYTYLTKRLSATYGYLGALFFLSIPIIVKLSITVYVDLGLIFFTTASLLLLFQWLETDFRKKYLILAGICCGLAMGTKYNGLLILFLLTLFTPILYLRAPEHDRKTTMRALQAGSLFFFCALLIASPWYIRNYLWTGNPFFPLYDGFFNPTVIKDGATAAGNGIQGVFARRYVLYGEKLWQLLLLPVRIFFQGMDDDPRYFDGRLNPFLFLLPLIAFLYRSRQKKQVRLEKITLLCFCLLYFLFAFNTGVLRIRYLTPMIPFLVLLAMYGLHNLELLTRKYVQNSTTALIIWSIPVALMLLLNGIYIAQQFRILSPLSYITGRVNRDEYLAKYRPEYTVMQYANTHLPDSAKILCVFMGRRGYYLNKDHIFDQPEKNDGLLAWIKQRDSSSAQIQAEFKQQNITHLLIRTDLFTQWLQENTSPDMHNKFSMLNPRPLYSYSHYTLYQINPQ